MGIVYLRTNLANGMQYVGQAKDFKKREAEWRCISQKYANQYLYDCGSVSRAARGVYYGSGHHYKNSNWYYKDEYEKMLAEQPC